MSGAAAATRPRVLVVDDEPCLLGILSSLLEEEGYEVVCAASGQEALGLAGREHFDLIVTDFKMPGLDGLETLDRAARLDPGACGVLMTGFVSDELRATLAAKGYRCLEKPFELEDLLAILPPREDDERPGAG